MPKFCLLFSNGITKKKFNLFSWRFLNAKKSFISTKILINLRNIVPITNFICNSSENVTVCLNSFNSMNIPNINHKNQNLNFSVTKELNKTFQTNTKNVNNYKFLKKYKSICKNSHKTNYMSLLNKNICLPFWETYLWQNSFCFKNYSNNSELEKKETKELFKKNGEKTESSSTEKHLSRKQKLKAAVRDYGVTVIIFHVMISLVSLGVCYLIVISGFDYSQNVAVEENVGTVETAAKFIVAYAIHKAFAPARIAITLTIAPFIVKKLKKIGILKPPKS